MRPTRCCLSRTLTAATRTPCGKARSTMPNRSYVSSVRACTASARDSRVGPFFLSIPSGRMPNRANQQASMRPVGPAPTINTSVFISVCSFWFPSQRFLLFCQTNGGLLDKNGQVHALVDRTVEVKDPGGGKRPDGHRSPLDIPIAHNWCSWLRLRVWRAVLGPGSILDEVFDRIIIHQQELSPF